MQMYAKNSMRRMGENLRSVINDMYVRRSYRVTIFAGGTTMGNTVIDEDGTNVSFA